MSKGFGVLVLVVAVTVVSGCIDSRSYSSLGQSCRSTLECDPGLICVDQSCEEGPNTLVDPKLDAGIADSSITDVSDATFPDLPNPVDTDRPDQGADSARPDVAADLPATDTGLLCNPGETECMTNASLRVCDPDGQGYTQSMCSDTTFCEDGRCVLREQCWDRDVDGFVAGPGCSGSIDCNDSNASVFPGAPEVCDLLDNNCDGQIDEGVSRPCQSVCGSGVEACVAGRWATCSAPQPVAEICNNGLDDDCNGQVDEGCTQCCTVDSCGPDQICDGCTCLDAPPDECLFQNQPCDPWTVSQTGDFYCIDFVDGRDGICMGLCLLDVPDPNATCPAAGSICAFEVDVNQGVCLDSCDPVTLTGCFPNSTCIAIGDDGGCVPKGDLSEGQACDLDAGPFGQCGDGLVCVEVGMGGGGGSCERLCNPFASASGQDPICQGTSACYPVDGQFGFCIPSIEQPEGSACDRWDNGQVCDDGVICARRARQAFECLRACRLDLGDSDCVGGGSCGPAPVLQADGIGLCR